MSAQLAALTKAIYTSCAVTGVSKGQSALAPPLAPPKVPEPPQAPQLPEKPALPKPPKGVLDYLKRMGDTALGEITDKRFKYPEFSGRLAARKFLELFQPIFGLKENEMPQAQPRE